MVVGAPRTFVALPARPVANASCKRRHDTAGDSRLRRSGASPLDAPRINRKCLILGMNRSARRPPVRFWLLPEHPPSLTADRRRTFDC